jgi:hypothetical protein
MVPLKSAPSSSSSSQFFWCAILLVAYGCGCCCANQVDIVVTETANAGITITIQGSLDVSSGLTLLGTDPSNAIDPFLKVSSGGTILLLDQKSTSMAYYMLNDDDGSSSSSSSWGFDCVAQTTDLFKFIDDDSSITKSIGIFVANGENGDIGSVVVTADQDYRNNIDESATISSVSKLKQLGLVAGTTCFMAFGNNRIQVQVIGSNNENEAAVASPPADDTAPSKSPVQSPSNALSRPTNSSITTSPTSAPTCGFFDIFCQGANLVGF